VFSRVDRKQALLLTSALVVAAASGGAVYQAEPLRDESAVAATVESTAAGAKVTLAVEGMTCAHCAKGLSATLRKAPGVIAVEADSDKKEATVAYDPRKQSVDELKKLVRKAGYGCK
jgi:copper chaperone CopZ